MMTVGNTHIVYASRESVVFRGRNGAPNFVYKNHTKIVTALGHVKNNEYYFADEVGTVCHFTFTPEANFEITKEILSVIAGPVNAV